VDGIRPTVSFSSGTSDPTNTSPIPVTVTFSESVTGFLAGDITTSNGSVTNFSGSGAFTVPLGDSRNSTAALTASTSSSAASAFDSREKCCSHLQISFKMPRK